MSPAFALAERLQQGAVEHLMHEGRLAGAGDAGDAAEQTERDLDVDAAKIVDARAFEDESFRGRVRGGVWGPGS